MTARETAHRGDAGSRASDLPSASAAFGVLGLAVAAAGLAIGLAATGVVLQRGWDPGAVVNGPWSARPSVGTPAIDPYARAGFARNGRIPLAASEGLAFTAETDSTGYQLLRTCEYEVTGRGLPSRFWTLTPTDDTGLAVADAGDRAAFTSSTIVSDVTGAFSIEVGPRARPGNWLPAAGRGSLRLVLRLYDTPFSTSPGDIAGAALPVIARRACGPP